MVSGAAWFVALPAVAAAQTSPAAAGERLPADSADASVTDIVVTAQRRSERLESVPMSIAAVTPAAAETKGVRSLQDLGQVVAGVQINFSGFATQPTIRGVSALSNFVGLENNVAVYVDGFYQDNSSIINVDFANLEGIQVLKGPQGTLYGRNATGGAFLVSTRAPSSRLEGRGTLEYATYNDRSASGYLSGPISDAVKFSVAGYARKSDGYYDLLDAAGQKIGDAAPTAAYAARAKLEVDLTPRLTATLAYNYTELSDPRGLMFTLESQRSPAVPTPVGRLYQRRTYASNRPGPVQRDHFHQPTLTVVYDTPIGRLSSYTGYSHGPSTQGYDVDGSYADLSYQLTRFVTRNYQENLDYNITAIKGLVLDVGANYWNNDVRSPYGYSYSGNVLRTNATSDRATESWAVFADAAYSVNDRLTVDVGGRYTHETVKVALATFVTATNAFAAPPLSKDANRLTFTNFSPRASIRYELAPRTNVYASVTRGFRSGYPQAIATSGTYLFFPVAPERITAYEVGFKTARPRIRFETAGFYYDYANLQVGSQRPNPLVPGQLFTVTFNAPKATIYGAEAQISWRPADRLNVELGGAWLHARYTDLSAATGVGLNAATGLNATGQIQDWSGKQMARSPNFSGNLGVSYEFADVLGGSLLAQGNVKATQSYVPNNPSLFGPLAPGISGEQRFRQPGYALVNGSLTWTGAGGLKVGVFVNNLTNVDYHLAINGLAFGSYSTWAPRRTVGVRLGYGFGR